MLTIKTRQNWCGMYDFGLVLMPGRIIVSLIFTSIQIDFSPKVEYNKACNFIASYDARENKGCIMLGRSIWYAPFSVR